TFVQNVSLSPSRRTSGLPHTGHVVGNFHLRSPFGRSARTGFTTSGMTSPALRTMTVSPGRTSLARTWSSLCNVASCTVDPPTNTGSRTANGVAFPVRPIDTMMSFSFVVRSSGGNLYAIAQRGAFDVEPNSARNRSSSTFTTTPSISYGRSWRCSCHRPQYSYTSSSVSKWRISGLTGSPRWRIHSSVSVWVANAGPSSTAPSWYVHNDSSRDAVIDGSFWRTDPAADLRGLANRRSPASAWRLFNRSKAAIGMLLSPRTSSSDGGE